MPILAVNHKTKLSEMFVPIKNHGTALFFLTTMVAKLFSRRNRMENQIGGTKSTYNITEKKL